MVFDCIPNILCFSTEDIWLCGGKPFSQYKHIAGGKLDAVNYTTARGAHLMKQIVSEHHSGAGYRDQTISVAELGLRKKSYNKQTK